jgi:23S rRNA (uracil1939-C5)-methyltransferase
MGKSLKNTLLTGIAIGEASNNGKCVIRWDNRVVFVEGAAPGDISDIRIIRKKKNYLEAITERVLEPSAIRQDPFCAHFGTCGGCKWQHIQYHSQLEFKRKLVVDSLERIAKLDFDQVQPTLPSPSIQYHRNKLEFTFSNYRWLTQEEIRSGETLDRQGVGFHKPRQFDKIVDIDRCYLQPSPSNEIRNFVRAYAKKQALGFFDIKKIQGFLRNLIVRTSSLGETMVILQVGQNHEKLMPLMQSIKDNFPQITSLYYVVNSKGNETFFDLEVKLFSGSQFITEKMGSLEFSIGPKSFYQTNSEQAYQLYRLVKDLCEFKGHETLYDLYTGAGTIALFMASSVDKVIGIEQVPEAIEDARRNAANNGIENSHFYSGDIKEVLGDDIISTHGKPNVVISDPPRAGMHQEVIQRLIELSPDRIVYVSCNPATQARDIALLSDRYQIKAVHPVDMFPHTAHVECVALLELRK